MCRDPYVYIMPANETAGAEPQPVATEAAAAEGSGSKPAAGASAGAPEVSTLTAPPATAAAPTAVATTDPSAAVNAAMMAERVIRRASLTGGGGMMGMGMANMNMGLMNPGAAMGLMNTTDSSLFERAMAIQTEQHNTTMALARASLGLDPNDPRASLGLGTLTPRGSLGLGSMGTRMSLGLGTMGGRRSSFGFGPMHTRASLGLGTMPMAAPAPPTPDAASGGDGAQSEKQTLLRLAQIRTARAEVQAAQARLLELETHTALAASGKADDDLRTAQVKAAAATETSPSAAASATADDGPAGDSASGNTDNTNKDASSGESSDKADARDLEAAETFLSMSGKKQQDSPNAAAAKAAVQPVPGMAPGMMVPGMAAMGGMDMMNMRMLQPGMQMFPRRVSMELLAQNAGGLHQIPNPALLAEAMIAERRLSNVAGAVANFTAAQERRSTLPMMSGNGMQPVMTMDGVAQQFGAGGNNPQFPAGVPIPAGSKSGSSDAKHRSRPADAPRRPLSAYNFFFIDERERLLKAMKKRDEKKAADRDAADKDDDEKKDGEKQEEDPLKDVDLDDSDFVSSTYDELMTLRLNNKEKPRPHRKTHGKIGFQTLAKLIATRWKALAEGRREHYKSLAAIDMDRYKERTQEYQKKKLKNASGEAIPTG